MRSRFSRNAAWIARVSGDDVVLREERNGRALQRLRSAAVEEGAGARERVDDAASAPTAQVTRQPG